MKKIEREVSQYIDRHNLLLPSGRYLVALSGGADSVALFRMLLRLDYKVDAVHCNFKLRGEESFRDEAFSILCTSTPPNTPPCTSLV